MFACLHAGFVPPANPHDELVLFHDLEEALDWHYDILGREQVGFFVNPSHSRVQHACTENLADKQNLAKCTL